ncbi:RepB family plasmid replication initiator protein [Rosenbergiella collisarenosi]|uniref:RepB family plasmid replication initiator protein n=1 Tax=Rosenbergiella collisarenosi TaxID=1544695 RepID=UPI001F4E02CB|nr:RepB family plasmid replication initiator protein [Rosenbergiella collisarenosi]
MSLKNNESYLKIEEINKDTGELLTLTSTSETSVQVVPLMRLSVFVPVLKSTNKSIAPLKTHVDATDDLRHLSIVKTEGFQNVKISGPRLDMDTDFKVWVGIISSLTDNDTLVDNDGNLCIKFSEFARKCGYPRGRLKADLKDKVNTSIKKIMQTIVEFTKNDGTEHSVTRNIQLIGESTIDLANDIVKIKPNKSLLDLYASEYKVLLKLKAIKSLARKESAQALYLYLEALPQNPVPIKIERLRERLNLTSRPAIQNSVIRKALAELESIGYLEYQELKEGSKISFRIINRNPALK